MVIPVEFVQQVPTAKSWKPSPLKSPLATVDSFGPSPAVDCSVVIHRGVEGPVSVTLQVSIAIDIVNLHDIGESISVEIGYDSRVVGFIAAGAVTGVRDVYRSVAIAGQNRDVAAS